MAGSFPLRIRLASSDRADGDPILNGALCSFDCDVLHEINCGSHYVFVGEVEQIELYAGDRVLVYANCGYGSAKPLAESA